MPAGNTIIRKMVFSGHPFVSIVPFPSAFPDASFTPLHSIPYSVNPFSEARSENRDRGTCEIERGGEGDGDSKETMDRHMHFLVLSTRGDKN